MKRGTSTGEKPAAEGNYAPVPVQAPLEVCATPVFDNTTMEVVAPANLPEGYEFTVQDEEGRSYVVAVPAGGVREGELFSAVILREGQSSLPSAAGHNIVSGRWRDSCGDCCAYGCCHPVICLAYWCGPVLLGQIMTRMKLDPLANPVERTNGWSAFKVMLVLLVFVLIFEYILSIIVNPYISPISNDSANPVAPVSSNMPGWVIFALLVRAVLHISYYFYILYAGVRTRAFIRSKYNIPEKQCRGCEDLCCMCCCGCCSLTQMARHTADYDLYAAACCSETGLSLRAPTVA